jgi:hypothetical protein
MPNNIDRKTIPFTIVNNSGSDAAYLYMFGTTDGAKPQNNTYFLSDFNGNCTKFQPNQQPQPQGLALNPNGTTDAQFPQLDGVRVYISLDEQLVISTDEYGIPIAVSADNPAPGNPNYLTLWDFVEATWHDYGDRTILHVNTTQVDAFGLALKVEHSGKDPASPDKPLTIINGFDAGNPATPTRWMILRAFSYAQPPWRDLLVIDPQNPDGNPIRVLAPIKALDQNKFPDNWLDINIAIAASQYDAHNTTHAMLFTHQTVRYLGTAHKDQQVFTFYDGEKTYTIPFPTTRQCFANDVKVEPNDGTGGALAAAFGATILRGTLGDSSLVPVPQEQRSMYYKQYPSIFEYSSIIHQYGINNHAFCFGYDEVAGDAGANRDVRNPEYFELTIQNARTW